MPTTTNFGWTTPADTDLVKDGASAIRTLGNGIDTSLVDLKGGTTGQVLSKASNTDMDFSWVAAGTGANYSLLNAGGTTLTGAQTITVSGISGIEKFIIYITASSSASASSTWSVIINGDTTSNQYVYSGNRLGNFATYNTQMIQDAYTDSTRIILATMNNNASCNFGGAIYIDGGKSTGAKSFQGNGMSEKNVGTATHYVNNITGIYKGTAAITSLAVYSDIGNWDSGSVFIYGSAN